jgi:hypothetical protein
MILLSTIVFFVIPALAFPSSAALNDLKIPAQIGSVKEIFRANPQDFSNGTTIIQIQDAHCNYEAQKNLASILEYLIKEKNLKLVMVEGGAGDVTLSFLRNYADKKDREQIADKYLKSGKISGEEYLDIVSDLDFQLYGIEDPALYDSNLDAFLTIETFRDDALKDIKLLRKNVETLKPVMFNDALRSFEQRKSRYESKENSLSEYAGYIKERAKGISLKTDDYPAFSAFTRSAQLEKEIDFKQAETQRGAFIKQLASVLDQARVKELIAKTQDFKAQKLSSDEYYAYLKKEASGAIDLKQAYPQLDSYMAYIGLGSQIKPEALTQEIAALEIKIKESLFVNEDEKKLSAISDSLSILERFLKLDLTPQEYEGFVSHRDDHRAAPWIKFLADNSAKFDIAQNIAVAGPIDDNIDTFNDFYRIGLEREKFFIKNISDKLSLSGDRVAVVITGGFHTPGLSKLFKERGYSYAVVTPAISQKADPEVYYSVLRGERGEIEDTYLAED